MYRITGTIGGRSISSVQDVSRAVAEQIFDAYKTHILSNGNSRRDHVGVEVECDCQQGCNLWDTVWTYTGTVRPQSDSVLSEYLRQASYTSTPIYYPAENVTSNSIRIMSNNTIDWQSYLGTSTPSYTTRYIGI